MNLSVVIINWNTRQLLDECLASIYRETKDIDFEIFVVDNASSDRSAEMVREKYLPAELTGATAPQRSEGMAMDREAGPAVRLIENKENCGFAAANNQALREAKGNYILILNPDTIIKNNAINKALDILSKRPEIGILGPKTYNNDGTIQKTVRRDPTISVGLLIAAKLQRIFPSARALKNYYYRGFDYSREAYVPQIQGSFMLIRRAVLDKIGFFDERFFIWFEEVDLCLRAKAAGWKILYSPVAEIIHYGGESFAQVGTIKKQLMFFRSMFRLFQKHKFFKN